MLKIKDNIINDNKIIQMCINEDNNLEIDIEHGFPIVIKDATLEDIEWNYGSDKAQISLQNQLVKLQQEKEELEEELKFEKSICSNQAQRINKAIEYIEEVKTADYIRFIDSNKLIEILKGEE